MEEKVTVVCPNCRSRLSFKSFPGYQERIIECPHCHHKAQASGYLAGANARGAVSQDDSATQIAGFGIPRMQQDLGQLRIMQTGQLCPLKKGQNIIGRIAQTGTADIKVTKDPYMSRQHARIDVVDTLLGTELRLYEINSTNVIKLNGKEISRGDVLVLKFGDVLTMGMTDIKVEASSDEATRIV